MKIKILSNIIRIDNISNKEKLALSVTILALLLIIMSILFNNKNDIRIEYKDFDIERVIEESLVLNNKQIYFDLQEIISSYLASYNLEIESLSQNINYENIKYTREEYYAVLTEEYKKQINKKEYMQLSERFCEKFLGNSQTGKYMNINDYFIKDVYLLPSQKYGEDMYMCRLNTNDKDISAYIGIKLNQVTKTYSIFYIE